jgi:putative tricarboxylic transport membrane protein
MDLFITGIIESSKMCVDPILLLFILVAVIWGNIAGALPGIGPNLAIGVALPFTYGMTAVNAIAFLVAINVAVSYGNSIPAILVGVPGTTSAVLTAIDGYELHKKGKSGLALGVQYYGAMFGAFVGIFFFIAMVVPLSGLTYVFLTPEMAALYILGMTTVTSISSDNIAKGIASAVFGVAICTIGRDPVSAVPRFGFFMEMRNGIEVIPVGSLRDAIRVGLLKKPRAAEDEDAAG